MTAYSVFADGLSQTPVFASPLDRGRFISIKQAGLKSQVLDGLSLVEQLFERIDPNLQVHIQILLCDLFVTAGGFDAAGDHRLVGDQQQGARWNFVLETCDEERGRFHINRHDADAAQVRLEFLIVLPDAAIGRVNRTRPIVPVTFADRG